MTSNSRPRILVTGGAGFLGSHLVDALIARGECVAVLDNLRRGSPANLAQHRASGCLVFMQGDVREEDTVAQATAGVEIVYHLAAQSNVLGALKDPKYSFFTNVVGTYNVLQASASNGVRRVVFASSREVYGEQAVLPVPESAPLLARNPYGASKIAGEAYCRTFDELAPLECFVLRFANIYGHRDHDRVIPIWLDLARHGLDLPVYGGRQVLDFVPVYTAVEALIKAAEAKCAGPINVGSGAGLAIEVLAARILSLIGGPSRLLRLPARAAEVTRFVADTDRMRSLLGISVPSDPLEALPGLLASDL